MARKPTYGTPNQSKAYLIPDRRRKRFLFSVVGFAAIALFVVVDALTSKQFLLSPGTLSKSHIRAGSDCAKCHAPFSSAVDTRCLGCHEPRAAVSRFSNKAHSEQIQAADRGTTGATRPETPPKCAVCHTEHQGSDVRLGAVQDGACRSCHGFRSLGSGHPEFAILRLQRPEAPGLRFPHKRHLEELAKKSITPPAACETCHHPTAGQAEFASISFDTDCASCHFKEKGTVGQTEPVAAGMIVTAEAIAASDPAASWAREMSGDFSKAPRDRLIKNVLRHRDAWILYNTTRLAPAAEGAAASGAAGANRAEIDAKIAALREEMAGLDHERSLAAAVKDPSALKGRIVEIETRASRLETEIADLDLRMAQASPDTTPAAPPPQARSEIDASLAEIDAALSLLASRSEPWARDEAQKLQAKRASIAKNLDRSGPGFSAAGLAARRGDLSRRLDDLAAAGGPASQIADLRRDLDAVGAAAGGSAAGAPPAVSAADLQASLAEIDSVLSLLDARPEGWAHDEAARLRARRDTLAPRVGQPSSGLSGSAFTERRAALSSMIDALGRSGATAPETADLKKELASIGAPSGGGGSEIAALRADRDRKARALAAAKDEAARLTAQAGAPASAPPTQDLDARRLQVEGEIHALEDLQQAPSAAAAGVDPEEAGKTIDKLVKPCLKCHLEVNHAIARTAAARSLLPAATFNHKAHVREAACVDCHGRIVASEEASDVSLDGIAKCQSCHKWRGPSDTCRSCHRYHPAGAEADLAALGAQAGPGGPS